MQFSASGSTPDRGAIMTPAGAAPGSIEETDLAVHYAGVSPSSGCWALASLRC